MEGKMIGFWNPQKKDEKPETVEMVLPDRPPQEGPDLFVRLFMATLGGRLLPGDMAKVETAFVYARMHGADLS
jgi:hypothetical protein